jgi:hypothetical protein
VTKQQCSRGLGADGLAGARRAHRGTVEADRRSAGTGAPPHVVAAARWLPASKVADTELGEVVVLDVDATIVVSHSEKANAAATFKGTFGFHPLGVWCDNTTELSARLRAGNAGANTAADHIEVLGAAIEQIPAKLGRGVHHRDGYLRPDSHGLLPSGDPQ